MKIVLAAFLFGLLGGSAAYAGDQCLAQDDYVNDGIIQPQIPRGKQLDRFAATLKEYGPHATAPFHGTSLVMGDSHVAYFPAKSLAADFNATPQDIAIFGIDGTTAEELWWMIDHLSTGFDWTDSNGMHQGFVDGIDVSHVVQVLIPNFGGNSIKRATDSSPNQIAIQEAGAVKDLYKQLGRSPRVLVTERMEGDTDGCRPYEHDKLNERVSAMAARSGSRFDYLPTPRWFTASGSDSAPHCGFDHSDGYYFILPKAVHYQPVFYSTFLDPVISAYFAGRPQPAPGGPITADCHPDTPPDAASSAAAVAGDFQGPF